MSTVALKRPVVQTPSGPSLAIRPRLVPVTPDMEEVGAYGEPRGGYVTRPLPRSARASQATQERKRAAKEVADVQKLGYPATHETRGAETSWAFERPEVSRSQYFWLKQGYPQYAGKYAPFVLPSGAKLTGISEIAEGLSISYQVPVKPAVGKPFISSGGLQMASYGVGRDETQAGLLGSQKLLISKLSKPTTSSSSLSDRILSGANLGLGLLKSPLPSYVYVPPRMGGKDLVSGAVGAWEAPLYSVSKLIGVSAPESPKTFSGTLLSPFKESPNIGLRMAGIKEWTGPQEFAKRSPEYWIGSALGELALSTALSIGISKAHQVASEKIVRPIAERLATTNWPFGQPSIIEKYMEAPLTGQTVLPIEKTVGTMDIGWSDVPAPKSSLNWIERQILQRSGLTVPPSEVSVPMAEKLFEYGSVKGSPIQPELTTEVMGFTEYTKVGGVWIGEPYPEKIIPMKATEYIPFLTTLVPKTDIYKGTELGFAKEKPEPGLPLTVEEQTSYGKESFRFTKDVPKVETKGMFAYRGWPTVRELQEQQKLLPLVTQTQLTREGIFPDVSFKPAFEGRPSSYALGMLGLTGLFGISGRTSVAEKAMPMLKQPTRLQERQQTKALTQGTIVSSLKQETYMKGLVGVGLGLHFEQVHYPIQKATQVPTVALKPVPVTMQTMTIPTLKMFLPNYLLGDPFKSRRRTGKKRRGKQEYYGWFIRRLPLASPEQVLGVKF